MAVVPGGKFAAEFEADHLGGEHVQRLAEHDGLGLDAADAPAQHAQAVDHRGMAIGADQRIGEGDRPGVVLAQEHALGQVLEVDLVYDAHGRRHDAEVLKGLLAPAEELVTLAVALELDRHVAVHRVVPAEEVDLHRVVDHQVDRHQRVDLLRIAAEPLHGASHGRQIDHARHAGEVLQDHPGRLEGHFDPGRGRRVPAGQVGHVAFGHGVAVAVSQHGFQQNADRIRQPRDAGQLGIFQARKAVDARGTVAGVKSVTCVKRIVVRHFCSPYRPMLLCSRIRKR